MRFQLKLFILLAQFLLLGDVNAQSAPENATIVAAKKTEINLSYTNQEQISENEKRFLKEAQEEIKNTQTYQIGAMVEALQSALMVRDQAAMQTIYLYGTDSRYYSMIRGWLFQELVGVESQLHASKGKKIALKFQAHSDFLKKAIRSIDLE